VLVGTRTSALIATARLLDPPGVAEVAASRKPDLARPVELSVAWRTSSSQVSALLVDQSTTLGCRRLRFWVRSDAAL
jgi:hypothetical protein